MTFKSPITTGQVNMKSIKKDRYPATASATGQKTLAHASSRNYFKLGAKHPEADFNTSMKRSGTSAYRQKSQSPYSKRD